MNEFRGYEMWHPGEFRELTEQELREGKLEMGNGEVVVIVLPVGLGSRSPQAGDMVQRNPADHGEQWVVSREYFESNFGKK